MFVLQLISLWINFQCLRHKVPEIYRIYKTKTVENLSISFVLLEETAYTFLLTYNIWQQYPLLAYCEYFVLFIQNLLILLALSKYSTCDSNKKEKFNNRSIPLYAIAIFCFYLLISYIGLVPAGWMRFLTIFVIPIMASSKIVQLKAIITNKDASQANRSVAKMAAFNNVARILTNFAETYDKIMIIYLFVSLILNTSIVIACAVYKYGPIRIAKDKKKKKTT
ncbi:unnamed protein product [Rotaria magnacalcarata]|uniref:Solute carrier family 66 member 3 n=2 Tax=Rotaria magnacalcarata TaxID=392030 RepID=A0A816XTV1_9BILA|nr:unnamed protein product [Rotaria magnacalcarata]CAF1622017.1 unnamed protein product [Rotaria magnacalcarata]CAF1902760.1 unnamed protein product [Rotaria magnacalcarata]CAF2150680.1 unnamed protein product [Rotaria magnacalcarata]CAF2189991.1 unnamed protein product [Rotaria magnacalcarata]